MYWNPGHQLNNGKYIIQEPLGQGAFGITYKAVQNTIIQLPVVIKTPNMVLRKDRQYQRYLEKFIQEAQLLGQLCQAPHPNIVRVLDYFEERDSKAPCLVMEFIAGKNLFDLVDQEGGKPPLPEIDAVNYIQQIGKALVTVHRKSIVHRDIHPGNIMLNESCHPILIDFGLAGDITPASSFSRDFGNKYFAPYEQFKGSKEPTVDIYGLAATLYYAITGECPISSWERKYEQANLIEPKQHNPSISSRLNQAILTGMSLETEQRPQSMQAWLDLLVRHPQILLNQFEFDVVKVNVQGKIIQQSRGRAEFVREELGNGIVLDLVKIPGGRFLMGSPEGKEERYDWEGPQHQVNIQPFWMGKFPVTQGQWAVVATWPKVEIDLQPDPSNFKGANRPVEQVSWDYAVEFCARLTRKKERSYRLPSEAEWEYACRAGTTTPFYFGETITTDLANYRGTDWEYEGKVYKGNYGQGPKGEYREETTDVGIFPPNSFGLYEMHGNIFEWCEDKWHENYIGAPSDGTAWLGSNKKGPRLLRGGSWSYSPVNCRAAFRFRSSRDNRNNDLGFRVVVASPRT
jgi:formylglycine-generating enzyme required for sulfatase activity/tRNA A-37 threonylcarbamoyl transferase component Bud32